MKWKYPLVVLAIFNWQHTSFEESSRANKNYKSVVCIRSIIFGIFIYLPYVMVQQFLLIFGTQQFLIGLLKNTLNHCQKFRRKWLLTFLQRRCVKSYVHDYLMYVTRNKICRYLSVYSVGVGNVTGTNLPTQSYKSLWLPPNYLPGQLRPRHHRPAPANRQGSG